MADQAGVASTAAASEESTSISLAADLKMKFSAARTAAVKAMASVGFPLELIVGPLVFAAAMAFEQGGKIPGAGAVPILGHGGETVVTRALTDRVEAAEGKGGTGGNTTHIHHNFSPTINAVDANGVDAMLKKHSAVFQKHITGVMRKMNKSAT